MRILFVITMLAGTLGLNVRGAENSFWSAEKRHYDSDSVPSSSIHDDTIVLAGWVKDLHVHRMIVDEAQRLFPVHDLRDTMREAPSGVTADAAIYSMRQLAMLASGIVRIEDGVLSINGKGRSGEFPINALPSPPADLKIGQVLVTPPQTKYFTWSVTKMPGNIKLDGFVPSVGARDEILRDVGTRFPDLSVSDYTAVGSGGPKDFIAAAKVGLQQLEGFDSGVAHISGTTYSVVASLPRVLSGGHEPEATAALQEATKLALPGGFKSGIVEAITPNLEKDIRSVDFLFATDRVRKDELQKANFSHERSDSLTFGLARVHVPDDHKIGNIELPRAGWTMFTFTLGKESPDPHKHFVIRAVEILDRNSWKKLAHGSEAIVFVHGYNTSFDDAVFRTAQVIWDLQYKGTAVLFSWPSRGGVLSYEYDRNSALVARAHFIELLQILEHEVGIRRVHVIAHSMGNLVVLDALANYVRTGDPIAISELVMAAPDVDRDQYRQDVKNVGRITQGMTLYASAADKAMLTSRTLAQGPRAGDVLNGLPTIVEKVDAIDVTAVGSEILGMDHDTFASKRSLINDIALVLQGRRPPNSRLAEIRTMPEGAPKPLFWRFVP